MQRRVEEQKALAAVYLVPHIGIAGGKRSRSFLFGNAFLAIMKMKPGSVKKGKKTCYHHGGAVSRNILGYLL